jgi:hypothetical protein
LHVLESFGGGRGGFCRNHPYLQAYLEGVLRKAREEIANLLFAVCDDADSGVPSISSATAPGTSSTLFRIWRKN